MKKTGKLLICFCILLLLFLIVFAYEKKKEKVQLTSASVSENFSQIENKSIGWGIKRNDNHETPDLGKENKAIMDEYDGICIGNPAKKQIYLTFDYGFEAGYTPHILDVLKENGVKATFFITAHYVNTADELVMRMIQEGHILGNHTVNHKSLPSISLDKIKTEVMDLHQMVYKKYQYEMKYIRPPKGEYSKRTIAYTNSLRLPNCYVVICL